MRQGRFITTAVAAAAVLAIGPASAMATPGSFTDDDYADFAAGTATNAWTVEPGEVRLLRTTALGTTNFDGSSLPSGWVGTAWPGGSPATVSGGSLILDGARLNDDKLTPEYNASVAPQVLEFRATFGSAPSQSVGFGDTFANPPYATFSTGNGTGLFARTLNSGGVSPVDTQVGNFVPGQSNLFRIEWNSSTDIKYYVNNQLIVTPAPAPGEALTDNMRPVMSDFTAGDGALKVDWINLGPHAMSGSFQSRVFDAGTDPDVTWGSLVASAAAGAPVIETRTGNTPTPDGSWSQFQGLSGNVITSPRARYIQYRTTGLTDAKPSLEKVVIGYDVDTSPPSTGAGGGSTGGGTTTTGGSSKTSGGSNSQADTTKPKVTLVAKSLKASKKGTVSFTVGCPATEQSCKITLKLKNGKKTVASKTVNVKGGKSKVVTLTLNKATKSLLKKRSSLKVSAVTTATDAAGNTRTTTKAMTLRRAGR